MPTAGNRFSVCKLRIASECSSFASGLTVVLRSETNADDQMLKRHFQTQNLGVLEKSFQQNSSDRSYKATEPVLGKCENHGDARTFYHCPAAAT